MTGVIADLRKIAEGREAEIFAWEDGRVLRLLRPGRPGDALAREAAAIEAVRAVTDAMAPRVYELIEYDGRAGMVMERIDGTDQITMLGRKPWLVASAGFALGRVHAEMHKATAPAEIEPLASRLRRHFTKPEVPIESGRRLLAALEALPDGDRLCHGDFHPGNILMSKRGPVVIDWANVTAGDPAADFARTDLLLKMGEPPPGSPSLVKYMQGFGRKIIRWSYRRAYLKARPTDADLVRRWQIVRVADRLIDDGIESERETLMAMLREAGLLVD